MNFQRPHYETEADRVEERRIAGIVCARWKSDDPFKLNANAYGLDFAVIRGRVIVAFLEAKKRNLTFGFGDGYYLALQKVVKGIGLTTATGLPCFMAIQFSDGPLAYADFSQQLPGAIIAGRGNPRDAEDIEPHCIYPWEKFTIIEGLVR